SLVRMLCSSVSSRTLKIAGCAVGFMTTAHASSPRIVVLSGRYQVRPSVGEHGSASIPDSCPPAVAIQETPTHAPKYSTSVAAPRVSAFTAMRIEDALGTTIRRGASLPDFARVVTRTGTGPDPGFVTASSTCQPCPPPCGQNHAPECAPAGVTDASACWCDERSAAPPPATAASAST